MLAFPILLAAQISDDKIPRTVAQYFHLNRLGPQLVSVDIFEHPQSGRVLKVTVLARRTQAVRDLVFTFSAAAAVANLAEEDIELLWVEMEIKFKELETTTALAPAACTMDAIINNRGVGNWWQDCLEFLWVQS